jgi:hypothetical protein
VSNTLNQFVASVNNPQPGPVRLSTGLVFVEQIQEIDCSAANVSDRTITVNVRLVDINGTVWMQAQGTRAPGTGIGRTSGLFITGNFRCEYTFTGFANDFRGTMSVRTLGAPTTLTLGAR